MSSARRALGAALAAFLVLSALLCAVPAAVADPPPPRVELSAPQAGKGRDITVSGSNWRPRALLMLLVCGRATPATGVIGGTNSCANADGRAVTTDSTGSFSKKVPVAEPPVPCPCVVHVATVMGGQQAVDAEFVVAGHPTAPLPEQSGGGRLAVLTATRLEGDSGLLVFFGAPPVRTLEFTVGNLGTDPVHDPVFEIGTAHGLFAPQWEEQQWSGTVKPGEKARITLPVQLPAGAHGDYSISVKYGTKVLAEQPWGVPRPWGVTVFWVLLALVVPAALFRIGMAVVDKVRPPDPRHARRSRRSARRAGTASADGSAGDTAAALPWLLPDAAYSAPPGSSSASPPGAPSTTSAPSAPSENRPTTKGHS
ncbi:hypothetical protein ACH46N_34480 [Streptomyces pristinaespiralis]|uniref:Neocarzinostatin family protein n=2 Tax=Streptomyces pristinaespiralis TaxID=38300 RepID=D6X636_STRE2|nr:hypothetical protein [Streptomyces pristinaespiralis]ALC22798.1 hypothetical protein SPRI_4492 [Streptomyces pristinaespiralis]EFH31512.1 conserved hypothetical protein [Streptomyces pristinaespiralis ATCC 25486]QMU14650.1 hypothetical protein H3L99_14410 [Streptomyces pristinaespiralis]